MACRLDGAKPLSEPCWNIVNSTLRNKLQWTFNRNSNIFIQENVLENVVCEMASILSRPQCVKMRGPISWQCMYWFLPQNSILHERNTKQIKYRTRHIQSRHIVRTPSSLLEASGYAIHFWPELKVPGGEDDSFLMSIPTFDNMFEIPTFN